MEDSKLEIPTLGYYIDRALCVMIKQLNKELKAEELQFHHSDYTIMKVLSVRDGLSQSELSRLLGKEKSGISRSLSALEKLGYIYRVASNGCTNHVFLSDQGKALMPILNEIAQRVSDKAMKGFTKKKRQEIMKNLTVIYNNSL